jgi:hypothetical protein
MSSIIKSIYDRRKIATVPSMVQGDSHENFNEVQSYLAYYGYLQPESVNPYKLGKDESQALKKFQTFMNIKETGMFDESTRDLMLVPRCGVSDLPALAATTLVPFSTGNLTYAFDNSTKQSVGPTRAKAAIKSAFQTWNNSTRGLHLTEVGAGSNPNILIGWRPANDPDFPMRGTTIAHADFPPGSSGASGILPLPLHFDDDEPIWTDLGAVVSCHDIETTTLHEIGHCLGLQHSGVSGSVMSNIILANFSLRTLHSSDLSLIRSLYP